MADICAVYNASTLIDTGQGQVQGMILTISTGNGTATLYDNDRGSGTKLFEASVNNTHPVIIFFRESFFIKYTVGCYLALAANMSAVVWTRQI